MSSLYSPLKSTRVEVELNVTMAHPLVKEILNGDHFEEHLEGLPLIFAGHTCNTTRITS